MEPARATRCETVVSLNSVFCGTTPERRETADRHGTGRRVTQPVNNSGASTSPPWGDSRGCPRHQLFDATVCRDHRHGPRTPSLRGPHARAVTIRSGGPLQPKYRPRSQLADVARVAVRNNAVPMPAARNAAKSHFHTARLSHLRCGRLPRGRRRHPALRPQPRARPAVSGKRLCRRAQRTGTPRQIARK